MPSPTESPSFDTLARDLGQKFAFPGSTKAISTERGPTSAHGRARAEGPATRKRRMQRCCTA